MKAAAYNLDFIRCKLPLQRLAGIRPEIVTAKLQAIRNFEYPDLRMQLEREPRLAELLWFIQAMSRLPGGLEKFAQDFLAEFPERIGGDAMHAIGTPKSGRYTIKECLAIWGSNSPKRWGTCLDRKGAPKELLELLSEFSGYGYDTLGEQEAATAKEAGILRRVHNALTPTFFWQTYATAALDRLPTYLASLCNEQSKGFVAPRQWDRAPDGEKRSNVGWSDDIWYVQDITGALLEMMDRYARKMSGSLANTDVTKGVFAELDYACSQKVAVLIAGDARFGKTKSVATWCKMWPGRARLVTVPNEPRERDFLTAHAEALGLDYGEKTSNRELRYKVEFVIRHSGLFLAYDESHFLLPASYNRNTVPRRLNWVRCQVIDRELGAAFLVTRQSYGQALSEFVKKTHYQMEQWIGRMERPYLIPTQIGRENAMEVARHRFPNLSADCLEEIVGEALMDDCPLQTIDFLAKRAQWQAERARRRTPSLQDVKEAIAIRSSRPEQKDFENVHAVPKAPANTPKGRSGDRLPTCCRTPAVVPQVVGRTVAAQLPAETAGRKNLSAQPPIRSAEPVEQTSIPAAT